jgi:hypothetical protein
MAQQTFNQSDERLNQITDHDPFWGPFIAFRPEKNRYFSRFRALALATTVGGVYGALLNVGLAVLCRLSGQHAPSIYGVPLVLTLTYLVGFQLTLGPAWNRRARLLVRRADYLQSIGRAIEQPR